MMPQAEALKPPVRPTSPLKASWFEFLLNPALLEEHLLKGNADPTPVELIIQFLHNAAGSRVCPSSSAAGGDPFLAATNNGNNSPNSAGQDSAATFPVSASDLNSSSSVSDAIQQQHSNNSVKDSFSDASDATTSRKAQALKLLALQVAAFLEWNLNEFETKLPLPMQETLLLDLLRTVTGCSTGCSQANVNVEWPDAREDSSASFALFLYHRWVLRTVVTESFPSRGQRGLNVQIPGQVDPCCVPPDVQEHLLKRLQESTRFSASFLEDLIADFRELKMPTLRCFGVMTEETPTPVHRWEESTMVLAPDAICQAAYDVGCFHFHQGDYPRAKDMFLRTDRLYGTLKEPFICKLSKDKLRGYVEALAETQGMNTVPGRRVEDYDVVIGQLMEENFKGAAPISFREEFEMDVLRNCGEHSFLYFKVAVCNAMHKTLEGKVLANNLSGILRHLDDQKTDFLLEALQSSICRATPIQLSFVKNVIGTICFTLPTLAPKLMATEALKPLMRDASPFLESHTSRVAAPEDAEVPDKPFTSDPTMHVKRLEKELLVARDLHRVETIIRQLQASGSRRLWSITNKWELPKVFTSHLKSLPPGLDQDYFYVLLAKAAELRGIKHYSEAYQLYSKVQKETVEMLPLLGRVIGWELLHTNLLRYVSSSLPVQEYQQKGLLKEAKGCVSAFVQERDFSPRAEVVELSLALLINMREWDFLADLPEQRGSGSEATGCWCVDFANVLASVCRDAYLGKCARTAGKELWDAVIPVFATSSFQVKRTSSGTSREVQRDAASLSSTTRAAFAGFTRKLKDTIALGVLLSCLAKIYNVLRDDPSNDVFLEYPNLWPSVVGNAGSLGPGHVTDALRTLIEHSLAAHPNHPSWLKIHGDFLYVRGHYSAAMKHYLSAAMVSSDYFSQPVPRSFLDDLAFRRMIQCCSRLQSHTQAAVLGQFLEEPNYATAFKSLGEQRICNDSCDSYYGHVWDVTLLEFLVNLHSRRGEADRKQLAIHTLGMLELNSNNNAEIQREAANLRKGQFLRALAKQYL